MHSQGFYFPSRAGGEEWIFGLYNNKQTDEQTKAEDGSSKPEEEEK